MFLFDKGNEWGTLPIHLQSYIEGLPEKHLLYCRLVSEPRHILTSLSTELHGGGKQHGVCSEVHMPQLWCRQVSMVQGLLGIFPHLLGPKGNKASYNSKEITEFIEERQKRLTGDNRSIIRLEKSPEELYEAFSS